MGYVKIASFMLEFECRFSWPWSLGLQYQGKVVGSFNRRSTKGQSLQMSGLWPIEVRKIKIFPFSIIFFYRKFIYILSKSENIFIKILSNLYFNPSKNFPPTRLSLFITLQYLCFTHFDIYILRIYIIA